MTLTIFLKIGWLLIRQRRDFLVLKLVHQALYSSSWPSYIPLDTVKHLPSLRSGAATRLIIPMERGTFQDSAVKLFNVLPANIRNVAISKYTVGKLMPMYQITFVNSL